MTDTFAQEYQKTSDGIRDEFIARKTRLQVKAVGQSIVQASAAQAEVLLFLNQHVEKVVDGSPRDYARYRALITVVHTDQGWLVEHRHPVRRAKPEHVPPRCAARSGADGDAARRSLLEARYGRREGIAVRPTQTPRDRPHRHRCRAPGLFATHYAGFAGCGSRSPLPGSAGRSRRKTPRR